ncbi:glucose 1-dehydrogenase [Ferrimonas sp. SCSIO 43195]|uniref:glucose 1-dehydrogenase n=1 Tax=Ferrimonas TaxID=44011 RepID=UPI00353078B0
MTQPGLLQLQGKVALITGASRGIGEAVARLYAAHGARVILSSRDQQALDAVAASIRDQGGQAEGIACHGGDIDQAKALFATIEQRYGRLDILVNNAAANPYFGHILDTPQEALNKTVQVNLAGYFCFAQLAGQMMREQGGGVIINTASVNGKQPAPGQGIYSITKAAVNSMTAAFAKECAQYNIRVNAVLPGLTETKFASALTDNPMLLKQILPLIPQGRSAVPEEIAPAFLFLASDAAAYITGIELPVDGGYLA